MKRDTKEAIQYGSAIGMLILHGEIHDSVLWLFAQCLLYAGAVFGVSVYITDRFNRLENKLFNKKEEDSK